MKKDNEVSTAFELLLEEIEYVVNDLNEEGAQAFKSGNYDLARKAIEHATRLTDFREKVKILSGTCQENCVWLILCFRHISATDLFSFSPSITIANFSSAVHFLCCIVISSPPIFSFLCLYKDFILYTFDLSSLYGNQYRRLTYM